jgi:pyruvate formate lyase activating enzyme
LNWKLNRRHNLEIEKMTGLVFDIKKFAIHDGPGIRTTVFLKGCPLTCLWCHNPESQARWPEISFLPEKCIGCGFCFKNCPRGLHEMQAGKHVLNRTACVRCGECTAECYAGALEIIGKNMTVEEVLDDVLKDRPFYETSGGGMTISGGEPIQQFEFTKALLVAAKENNLHTCLDTSGWAAQKQYRQLIDSVDIFLYDLKETDPAKHEEFTGVTLAPILKNLREIDRLGKKIMLRCPIIPGLNDREEHLREIARIANGLKNLLEIDVLPYHPLGKSKSARIGKISPVASSEFPKEAQIKSWCATIQAVTAVPVKRD